MGSGELTDWQEVHALPAADSNLVFIQDSFSVRRFLVNTCFGAVVIPLLFGSRHFSWSFQLAPVSVPILGSDFLRRHALLVDVARARVLGADSLDVLSAVSSPAASDPFSAHLQQAPREI